MLDEFEIRLECLKLAHWWIESRTSDGAETPEQTLLRAQDYLDFVTGKAAPTGRTKKP